MLGDVRRDVGGRRFDINSSINLSLVGNRHQHSSLNRVVSLGCRVRFLSLGHQIPRMGHRWKALPQV